MLKQSCNLHSSITKRIHMKYLKYLILFSLVSCQDILNKEPLVYESVKMVKRNYK